MTSFSLPWYAIIGAQKGVEVGLPVLGTLLLAVVGPTAGRWYADVTSGVPPKHFVRGEWFVGTAMLTGAIWVCLYWLLVQQAGESLWWPTLLAFAIGYALLGRKIARKSQRELRDLGLLVENGGRESTA